MFTDDTAALATYHSKRLGLRLALPDGRAWRIDDHSRPEFVAKHGPTRSMVLVAVLRSSGNVGRSGCEDMARATHLVPEGALQTLDDETILTQGTFDTRIEVAVRAGAGPREPLVGHVMAFGGFMHKCIVFDYSTEVDGASDEGALSARLAYARARIFASLTLDSSAVGPGVDAAEAARAPAR